MTLRELMEIASKGYPNECVLQYHNEPNEDHGDTLAQFVAMELAETFEESTTDAEQCSEARHVLERAIIDLQSVIDSLSGSPTILAAAISE